MFEDKLKGASVEQKLKAVDKKLSDLYKRCPKSERAHCLTPILMMGQKRRSSSSIGHHRRAISIAAALVVAFLAYLAYEPDYFLLRAFAKKSMILAFPNFPYKKFFEGECLLDNPSWKEPAFRLDANSCQDCIHESVQVVDRVERAEFAEMLLDSRPTIISDNVDRWIPNRPIELFKFNEFVKLHFNVPEFRKAASFCAANFKTPADTSVSSVPQLFNHLLKNWKNNTLHFSASWTNCDKTGYNEIRNFYDKAYFLPEMTEVTRYQNSVLMSSRQVSKDEDSIWVKLEMNEGSEAVWIAQIHGNMQLRLLPKPECSRTCKRLTVTLNQGETINVVHRFYNVYFRAEKSTAVALAVSYLYN